MERMPIRRPKLGLATLDSRKEDFIVLLSLYLRRRQRLSNRGRAEDMVRWLGEP